MRFFFNNPNNRIGVYHYDGHSSFEKGHAVVIVSYDETNQYWLCKNSWGDAWADSGYFRIGYGQCLIESWENSVATVNQSCYAKISPNLISSLTTALNYSYANNEYAYVYSGTNTLTGSVNPIPSNKTLVINSGTTVNLNGFPIISTGGTIIPYGNITCTYLMQSGVIKGLFPTIQSAVNYSSSGQSVELQSRTHNESFSLNSKSGITVTGSGISSTTINGSVNFSSSQNCTLTNLMVTNNISLSYGTSNNFLNTLKVLGNIQPNIGSYSDIRWVDLTTANSIGISAGYSHAYIYIALQ